MGTCRGHPTPPTEATADAGFWSVLEIFNARDSSSHLFNFYFVSSAVLSFVFLNELNPRDEATKAPESTSPHPTPSKGFGG